jgi:hypothetical protein
MGAHYIYIYIYIEFKGILMCGRYYFCFLCYLPARVLMSSSTTFCSEFVVWLALLLGQLIPSAPVTLIYVPFHLASINASVSFFFLCRQLKQR